jgi:hypothetical protein
MIYKARMYLSMAAVAIGVWCLKIIERVWRPGSAAKRVDRERDIATATAIVALFAISAIGFVWWAVDRDSAGPCHSTPALRIRADGLTEQVVECR